MSRARLDLTYLALKGLGLGQVTSLAHDTTQHDTACVRLVRCTTIDDPSPSFESHTHTHTPPMRRGQPEWEVEGTEY